MYSVLCSDPYLVLSVSLNTVLQYINQKITKKPQQICNGMKEGNVLFNDALNTIYLRLYGVNHMVKDHSDSERGNPLSPHGLLFPISSKGSSSHRQDNTYHGLCYTSRGALAGTRNIQ